MSGPEHTAEALSGDGAFVLAPPDTLYAPSTLYEGYDAADELSLGHTLDFRAYLGATIQGRRTPRSAGVASARALHDSAVTTQLAIALRTARPVAVMGGHKMARSSESYRAVADLSMRLSTAGYLMLSGGGPGAMEATHLGARLSGVGTADGLSEALEVMRRDPSLDTFPLANASELIVGGNFSLEALKKVEAWLRPAFEVSALTANHPGESIGIPTWLYGHEPSTPLATRLAKYYDNSIREDGLLAVATSGIIYTPGRAGTLQEIFQDAAQNYYPAEGAPVSPMVFLDIDEVWSCQFPVLRILRSLFGEKTEDFIYLVKTAEEAAEVISAHFAASPVPTMSPQLARLL